MYADGHEYNATCVFKSWRRSRSMRTVAKEAENKRLFEIVCLYSYAFDSVPFKVIRVTD